ncbi:hypothetical protein PSEUBRA_003844 [Kalmanozyma brasiliensis GHG001]|uniref:uncharacterized protein n=1 Tax=Kalmanozyma brasiliensis (strain GHG001) TaxID=1365824 RepID=UPI001CE926EC|nr:uncharacterized protein PSEUBRA_003844 [Kalmanozyma brasiliensis GHG001]KAF6767301.1 hypothetical protein PSEUBRA_003844 [Kalmanozyma brasiliensis GHG001]
MPPVLRSKAAADSNRLNPPPAYNDTSPHAQASNVYRNQACIAQPDCTSEDLICDAVGVIVALYKGEISDPSYRAARLAVEVFHWDDTSGAKLRRLLRLNLGPQLDGVLSGIKAMDFIRRVACGELRLRRDGSASRA